MRNRLWLTGVLFCVSCTVGPDYHTPEIYSDGAIEQALSLRPDGRSVSVLWYESFQDPTLNMLIESALKQSPTVAVGLSKLRQARTVLKINKVSYLPMLDFEAAYDRSHAPRVSGFSESTNYMQLGFDASWEIDLWGAGRRLTEQSEAEFEQSKYNLAHIQTVLTAEVAQTYFQWQTTREKLRIARNNLALQKGIFETVQSKYAAGLTDISAYRQAAYVLDSTTALIAPLESDETTYQNALAVLVGTLPGDVPLAEALKRKNPLQRDFVYDVSALTSLSGQVIRRRPDVRAAERALAAQNAAVGQAVAAMYPNVGLSALFGIRTNRGSKIFERSSEVYGYTPSAVLPLFEWSKLENTVDLQKEKTNEAYQTYRQTVLQAVEELGNAITAVGKTIQARQARLCAAKNMRQALNAVKKQYENGLIEFSALLQAEQNLLTAETDLATVTGALYQNIIAFYKATGGGRAGQNQNL